MVPRDHAAILPWRPARDLAFLAMTAILLITIAAITFWMLGGIALRWGGFVALALGFAVAFGVATGPGLILLLAGTLGWLIGHLHYRVRRGDFKSGLASLVLGSRS
jgi:hypothetical protein